MEHDLDAPRGRGLAPGEFFAVIPRRYGRAGTERAPVHAATKVDGALVPVCGARPRGDRRVFDASFFAKILECHRCRARALKAGRI